MQPPKHTVFMINPYYTNYLIIKRLPTGYDGLSADEKFKLIVHSGITMRRENKKFDPKKEGVVVLIEWNVDKATKAGF
jgi:hypothetical protein